MPNAISTNAHAYRYGIDNTQIITDEDGNFELLLCAKRPPNCVNWLRIDRDTTRLCVRQTFLDKDNEVAADLQGWYWVPLCICAFERLSI